MKPVMLQETANLSHSWWWDSHVSPKHSRWLKENLTDMDVKVKDMLKLIEEDADSFAKRAEMYYKKRPELVSLVEEFYRAYRALAERYDHITGELHQVQHSMAEAFPNHIQYGIDGDSPRASFVNCHSQSQSLLGKEFEGFGAFVTEAHHQYLESRQITQVFPCSEEKEKETLNPKVVPHFQMHKKTESSSWETEIPNEMTKLHKEILNLQQENGILKRDSERGAQQYKFIEKQLLQMQEELHHIQQENHKINEDSSSHKAQINELEEQVCSLKKQNNDYIEEGKILSHKLQSAIQEKDKLTEIRSMELTLHNSKKGSIESEVHYECPNREQATEGNKSSSLQDKLSKLQHENYNLSMQVMTGVQQLQKAKEEIQNLHQALLKSQAENDTMIFQYQQSLKLYEAAENRTKDLQLRMTHVQEENKRIKDDMAAGILHMKIIEEKAHNLEREKNAFQQEIWQRIQRTNLLQEGLMAKHQEEKNLSMRLQDETGQILKFDTALKSCQQLLCQSQEQQKRLTEELQVGNERLKDADKRIEVLEKELNYFQKENDKLMEKSSSAVMSIKNLEQEAYSLKQDKTNLLNEVAFRVDQRDALQQELYCLQEDRNDLERRFQTIMKQIEFMGLDAESIQSSFVILQNISQKLREHYQLGQEEYVSVPKIAQKMEELVKKNITLEISVSSHSSEVENFESEIKLLQELVQGLHKEEADLMAEHNKQVQALEVKLQNTHNLYSILEGENQQLANKLADALEHVKHLEQQMCNLQRERDALENKVAESTIQMSHSQKQVSLLEAEEQVLREKLQEETKKEQTLETEIEKLQQLICQIENQNQTLSDDCQGHIRKYSAAEGKVMELEKTILMQQAENDMLLCNLSSGLELNRELEVEIEKLQKLLAIPNNVYGQTGGVDAKGTKLLNSIVEEVKSLQIDLSHFQEENEKLLDDASAKTKNLEQLQKDMSVLCSEKELIEEEAANRLCNLSYLQKEISQLKEAVEAHRMELDAGMERERNLESEIRDLQQSLTSSLNAHLVLENEYQRMLEDYSSIMACLTKTESRFSEMEQENQTLVSETLAQISLITILESHIVQKDEKMQLLGEKLNDLQEKNAKLEKEQQSCFKQAQIQEAEIQQLMNSIGSFNEDKQCTYALNSDLKRVQEEHEPLSFQIQTEAEKAEERDGKLGEFRQQLQAIQVTNEMLGKVFPSVGQEHVAVEMTGEGCQQQISMLTEETMHLKCQIPVACEDNVTPKDTLPGLQGEKQISIGHFSSSAIQANNSQAEVDQVQEQGGKYREQDLEAERPHETLQLLQIVGDGHQKQIDEYKNCEARTWEFQGEPLSLKNEKGKHETEETPNDPQINELEVMVGDLEDEEKITGAQASSMLRVSLAEDVCAFKEQNTHLLAQLKAREADIQKLQENWRRWFEKDTGRLQETHCELNDEVVHEMHGMQQDTPTVYQFRNELGEKQRPLKDEYEHRFKELFDAWARLEDKQHDNIQLKSENRSLKVELKISEHKMVKFHEERIVKYGLQFHLNDVEALNAKIEEVKELETPKLEMRLEEKLQPSPVVFCGLGDKSEEVQDLHVQIAELQVIVRDLQQENIKLKGERQKNTMTGSNEGVKKEIPHLTGQNSRLMLVKGPSEDQEEKEVLVDEVKGWINMENKVRRDMDLLQEQSQKFWIRFDCATQQIQKLQNSVQDLQAKYWKLKQDNKKVKDDQRTGIEYNAIKKQFQELQGELLVWLEHNNTLTKEVQYRFASVNRIQEEIGSMKGGHSGDNNEQIDLSVNHSSKLEREILSMQEQNSKIADMLQAGSVHARGLEFEVERILLRFQEKMEMVTEHHKKAYVQKVRIPLRTFLFGKRDHGQKRWASFACIQPTTNE
eukprot:Gb_01776 [translate_table: standard]